MMEVRTRELARIWIGVAFRVIAETLIGLDLSRGVNVEAGNLRVPTAKALDSGIK